MMDEGSRHLRMERKKLVSNNEGKMTSNRQGEQGGGSWWKEVAMGRMVTNEDGNVGGDSGKVTGGGKENSDRLGGWLGLVRR